MILPNMLFGGGGGEEDPKWKMPIKVGNLLEPQQHHHKNLFILTFFGIFFWFFFYKNPFPNTPSQTTQSCFDGFFQIQNNCEKPNK